jgi:hypothetical protein
VPASLGLPVAFRQKHSTVMRRDCVNQ